MFILSQQNSVANHFISELRDVHIQKDRRRFRQNMTRLGQMLAYELSKTLPYKNYNITTPLGTAEMNLITEQPVLATILRAGLPLYDGFLDVFDKAESAFIGAYRGGYQADSSFDIELHYVTTPNLEGKTLILIDPMLATGKSFLKSYKSLLKYGNPSKVHIVAAIGSKQGVNFVEENLPEAHIWLGDLDEALSPKSYIVPGLGDAGDLAFGVKM
ncbi:MAG: uracil phosphoribosyltransferase [Verrucomicrobia bacterium]|nr:uracil phosphoribosyltransferase [Cytophagales bacterium]